MRWTMRRPCRRDIRWRRFHPQWRRCCCNRRRCCGLQCPRGRHIRRWRFHPQWWRRCCNRLRNCSRCHVRRRRFHAHWQRLCCDRRRRCSLQWRQLWCDRRCSCSLLLLPSPPSRCPSLSQSLACGCWLQFWRPIRNLLLPKGRSQPSVSSGGGNPPRDGQPARNCHLFQVLSLPPRCLDVCSLRELRARSPMTPQQVQDREAAEAKLAIVEARLLDAPVLGLVDRFHAPPVSGIGVSPCLQ